VPPVPPVHSLKSLRRYDQFVEEVVKARCLGFVVAAATVLRDRNAHSLLSMVILLSC